MTEPPSSSSAEGGDASIPAACSTAAGGGHIQNLKAATDVRTEIVTPTHPGQPDHLPINRPLNSEDHRHDAPDDRPTATGQGVTPARHRLRRPEDSESHESRGRPRPGGLAVNSTFSLRAQAPGAAASLTVPARRLRPFLRYISIFGLQNHGFHSFFCTQEPRTKRAMRIQSSAIADQA
jgi:hypothetical protein